MALTAVDVMLHVPKRPRYLPKKVEAIGRELRQLESQTLTYEGAAANAEAVRLMEMAETSVDAIMERWNIWKKGEALYPSYLLANQAAAERGVTIRRLLILSQAQMENPAQVEDAIGVMNDQQRVGIKIFFGFREALVRSATFKRLEEDFQKYGAAEDINAAMFDEEILIFSQAYGEVPLGVVGTPTPIVMINKLEIAWRADITRDLNPAPLFDMTRFVFEYGGAKAFRKELDHFLKETQKESAP